MKIRTSRPRRITTVSERDREAEIQRDAQKYIEIRRDTDRYRDREKDTKTERRRCRETADIDEFSSISPLKTSSIRKIYLFLRFNTFPVAEIRRIIIMKSLDAYVRYNHMFVFLRSSGSVFKEHLHGTLLEVSFFNDK